MVRLCKYLLLIFLLCFSLSCTTVVAAQGVEKGPASSDAAVTTKDPDIPVGQLEFLLMPLTVDEVEVEVKGWQALLKAKVKEIRDAEIAATYQK